MEALVRWYLKTWLSWLACLFYGGAVLPLLTSPIFAVYGRVQDPRETPLWYCLLAVVCAFPLGIYSAMKFWHYARIFGRQLLAPLKWLVRPAAAGVKLDCAA